MICAVLLGLAAVIDFGGVQASPSARAESPLVGTWVLNLSQSKLPSDYPYRSMTLKIVVVFDTVTIGTAFVTASGQQQSPTELFHMDGKEHPGTLNPGVSMTGKWIGDRMIETGAKKDGHDVGVITYEVSTDGRTLTQKYSGLPEQTLVFTRSEGR